MSDIVEEKKRGRKPKPKENNPEPKIPKKEVENLKIKINI